MPRADRLAAVAALLLAAAVAAQTPPEREAQPVDIQADFGEIDRVAGRGVYRGNVVITQGGMRITAAEVRIFLEADELARVEIDGTPATFEHLPAGATQPTRGMARNMVYEVKASTVELKGEARVEQRDNTVAGQLIRYDLKGDRVLATSGANPGDRVNFTITPRRAKPEAKPEAKPAEGKKPPP